MPKQIIKNTAKPLPNAQKEDEEVQLELFPSQYIVLAADLSLKRPGFSVIRIDRDAKKSVRVLETFSVDNKKNTKPRGQILFEIKEALDYAYARYHPDYYVREKAINSRGAMSEIAIFEVVGITDYWLWKQKKTWADIYPVTVKKQITGDGRADKDQVAQSLSQYVGERNYHNDDESDATAVGLAWLIQEGQLNQMTHTKVGGTANGHDDKSRDTSIKHQEA